MAGAYDLLTEIRSKSGIPRTIGLGDSIIQEFCQHDSNLVSAINEAHQRQSALIEEVGAATLM